MIDECFTHSTQLIFITAPTHYLDDDKETTYSEQTVSEISELKKKGTYIRVNTSNKYLIPKARRSGIPKQRGRVKKKKGMILTHRIYLKSPY